MSSPETPNSDEQYCSDCGEIIKENAEICPECGVRQTTRRKYSDNAETRELQKTAEKSKRNAVIISIFITPGGYYYVNNTILAVINFVTLNYLLLGFIIVPIHTMKIIENAREELEDMGVEYDMPN